MFVDLDEDDVESLRHAICTDFDEGTLKRWPREAVMRALGFDESHHIWEDFARATTVKCNDCGQSIRLEDSYAIDDDSVVCESCASKRD